MKLFSRWGLLVIVFGAAAAYGVASIPVDYKVSADLRNVLTLAVWGAACASFAFVFDRNGARSTLFFVPMLVWGFAILTIGAFMTVQKLPTMLEDFDDVKKVFDDRWTETVSWELVKALDLYPAAREIVNSDIQVLKTDQIVALNENATAYSFDSGAMEHYSGQLTVFAQIKDTKDKTWLILFYYFNKPYHFYYATPESVGIDVNDLVFRESHGVNGPTAAVEAFNVVRRAATAGAGTKHE